MLQNNCNLNDSDGMQKSDNQLREINGEMQTYFNSKLTTRYLDGDITDQDIHSNQRELGRPRRKEGYSEKKEMARLCSSRYFNCSVDEELMSKCNLF